MTEPTLIICSRTQDLMLALAFRRAEIPAREVFNGLSILPMRECPFPVALPCHGEDQINKVIKALRESGLEAAIKLVADTEPKHINQCTNTEEIAC